MFLLHLRAAGLHTMFKQEVLFHPTRKWRFDFADHTTKIAIELDGGTWGGMSGHNTGSGIARDMTKINEAQRLGWQVYRFDSKMIKSGAAIIYIQMIVRESRAA